MLMFVTNVASAAHAMCDQDKNVSTVTTELSAESHDNTNSDVNTVICDCCMTCSKHHNQAVLSFNKDYTIKYSAKSIIKSQADMYLSQLYYPPSKPPKA